MAYFSGSSGVDDFDVVWEEFFSRFFSELVVCYGSDFL